MTDEKGYNGWSNYETWNVKLWIDNDEGSYEYWRENTREAWKQATAGDAWRGCTRKQSAIADLAKMLESEHEENTPTTTGCYADLLNAALSEVDWHEIAEAMLDDEDLSDEENEEDDAEVDA